MEYITKLLEQFARAPYAITPVLYFPLALLTLLNMRNCNAFDTQDATNREYMSLVSFAPTTRLARALDQLHCHHLVPSLFHVASETGRRQCIQYCLNDGLDGDGF
jgi:hypothetical protein